MNPFTPDYSKIPQQFIPRTAETQKVLRDFSQFPSPYNSYIITGVRGSGKSVLLSMIAKYFVNNDDWVVADIDPHEDMMHALAARLYNNEKLNPLFANAKISLSFFGIGLEVEGSRSFTDMKVALQTMLDCLNKRNKRVLVTVDETISTPEMKKFATFFQSCMRVNQQIYLLMAGLPENIDILQNEDTLTFLHRTPKIRIESLPLVRIADKYTSSLGVSRDEAWEMTYITRGFPYAFQILGYYAFEKNLDIDAAAIECKNDVCDYVHEKIWSELTETDKNILIAMVNSGSESIKEIRITTGMEPNQFSLYRSKLMKRGLINCSESGKMMFTLPFLEEFVQEKFRYDYL